jgi:cobalt-zinc-cadmium efflux system protein
MDRRIIMGHGHHHHDHHHGDTDNIGRAFLLNVLFVIIEIAGGLLTNSVAILSDAIHDLGDSISLGITWLLDRYSKKGKNDKFTYGYKRLSVIGALISALILLVGTALILREAIPRLLHPEAVNEQGMIFIAIFGVLINGAAVLNLKKGKRVVEKVAMLHMLEDLIGWVAVLIGAVIMHFVDLPIIDPIMSIGISIFMFFNVLKTLKEVVKILIQAIPENVDMIQLTQDICAIDENIEEIHELNVWSMDGVEHVISFHMVVNDNLKVDEIVLIKKNIKHYLHHEGFEHITIDIENINNCTSVH